MPIKRRLSDAERLDATFGPQWKQLLRHKLVHGMWRYGGIDASPEGIMAMHVKMSSAKWLTSMPMEEKFFVYAFNLLLAKAFDGKTLLQKPLYDQLQRHVFAGTTEEKIMDCNIQVRQVYLWDIRPFIDEYRHKPLVLVKPKPVAKSAPIKVKPRPVRKS